MLRLFAPEREQRVSEFSTLAEFFEDWYVPALESNRRRRPISPATIRRRREAIAWWPRLMATAVRPGGPLLGEVTDDALATFAQRLRGATYTRGLRAIPLSAATQTRTIEEVMIVLSAAGPECGGRPRAGLLRSPPRLYVEPPAQFPKPTWDVEEAAAIVAGIDTAVLPAKWSGSLLAWRQLWRATIALWAYTGHRARTYQRLRAADLVEVAPGNWRLQIARSMKTGKAVRLAVHPRLLTELQAVRRWYGGSDRLLPWPIQYGAICDQHMAIQAAGGLAAARRFTPQAWRRWYAQEIAVTGFSLARSMAQGSLGHSSAAVTESHYAAVLDMATLQLPDIFSDRKKETNSTEGQDGIADKSAWVKPKDRRVPPKS